MKANNSLRINMPRALKLISFFFLGHDPTYPISDLSGSKFKKSYDLPLDLLQYRRENSAEYLYS